VLLFLLAVAGGVAVWQTSNDSQVAIPLITPPPPSPPPAVVVTPAPVPETPKPDVAAIPSSPAAVATDPVPSEPPPVAKVTKVKKRAHATRHAVKPAAKHAPTAASTRAPPTDAAPAPAKPVGRTRPAAQADDSENPL
jgi:hypothetical protein